MKLMFCGSNLWKQNFGPNKSNSPPFITSNLWGFGNRPEGRGRGRKLIFKKWKVCFQINTLGLTLNILLQFKSEQFLFLEHSYPPSPWGIIRNGINQKFVKISTFIWKIRPLGNCLKFLDLVLFWGHMYVVG